MPAPDDRDPYKILRVQKGATLRRIKEAYRKLADEHHPDHEGDEKTFKDVGWAYEILTKPGKLKAHEDEQVIAKAFVDARRREAARERREKERSDQQAQAVGDQFRGEETQLPLFRPPSGASSSPPTGTPPPKRGATPPPTPPPIRTPPPFTWPYGAWPPPPFTPPSTSPHSPGPRATGNPTTPPEPNHRETNPVLAVILAIFLYMAQAIAAVVAGFGALTLYVALVAAVCLGALWLCVTLLGYLFTGHLIL